MRRVEAGKVVSQGGVFLGIVRMRRAIGLNCKVAWSMLKKF